jgi:hypothetical protein
MLLQTDSLAEGKNSFQDINRILRCYRKGLLTEYEAMVMIAASATESLREHIIAEAQKRYQPTL